MSVFRWTHPVYLPVSYGYSFFFLLFSVCNSEFSFNVSLCNCQTQISIYSPLLLFTEDSINNKSLLKKINLFHCDLAWILPFGVQQEISRQWSPFLTICWGKHRCLIKTVSWLVDSPVRDQILQFLEVFLSHFNED